jgi:hypothetical protein
MWAKAHQLELASL